MWKKLLYFKRHFILLGIRFIGILALFASFKQINLIFGENTFGVFTTMVVFAQIGALVGSYGIPIMTMKQLCVNDSGNRINEESNGYIGKHATVIFYKAIGFIFLLLLSTTLPFEIFNQSLSLISIISVCTSILFMSLSNYNAQILRADDKTLSFQLLNGTLPYAILSILLLVGFITELTVTWLFIFYFSSHFLTWLYSYLLCKRSKVNYIFGVSWKNFKNISRLSFDYFSTQFIQQAFNWVTLLVTTYLISEVDTGGMNVITKYLSLTALLIMVTNTYQGPNYTNLFHNNKIVELNKSIKVNTHFMVLLSLPIIIILSIFPEYFLNIFSHEYVHLTTVFQLMLIGSLVNVMCGSVGMLMQMTHQQKAFRNIMLVALIIHVVLSYVLTIWLGVIGLGISLTLVLIFWNLTSALRLFKSHGVKSYLSI